MKHETSCSLNDGMSFDVAVGDHTFTIDAHENVGGQGKGPTPKPLMLAALAGCTAMDVIALMRKMRVNFTDFKVFTSGELTDEHPKVYKSIHLTYQVYGTDIDQAKVAKAVELSKTKYCGVNAMLKQVAAVTYEINYLKN